ncbi:tRNA (cytidine(34)-2'-O)-methyltransferase [Pararhizobium haloflavum]|uniref:tRNA (cytidine(34)-2'-O)-methyltransferase n=1 Tax=Pararhizobium haloflavum TaxID=2037914 RepID=UPI0018E4CA69
MSNRMAIALYQPDIPGNTGTIIRLAACLGCSVEIIEPAGFDLTDRALKRAGMDYVERAALNRHLNFETFDAWRESEQRRLVLLTTAADEDYADCEFRADDILLFGRESAGVPKDVHERADIRLTIPMQAGVRSLNVAMASAIVCGEAMRQLRHAR